MVESLTHEPEALAAVIREVRRAGVLVIKNTRTGRDWEPILEDPRDLTSSIAHVDYSGYGSPATLHLLHAKEGRSSPTAYAKRADLTRTMAEIRDQTSVLEETYLRLLSFYRNISRKSSAYVHHWEPGDTVLAYQDPEHQFEHKDPRIFHFNAGDGTYSDRRILRRDMALRLEGRRENFYKTSSAIRAEQSSWY